MSRGVRAAWLLLAAFWLGAASARADGAGDLESLRRAIDGGRERVAVYEREQRGLLEAVEALDRAIAALREEVRDVGRTAERAKQTLETVEVEAEEIRRRRQQLERAMSRRAVALYQAGSLGPAQLLFAASSVRDLLSRFHTLKLLLEHDAELLERHRLESAALIEAESRAREALRGRDAAVARLSERSQQLAAEREAKRRVVARLHRDRARERAALVELETAARALEETVDALGAVPAGSAGPAGPRFESLRHALLPPVNAPIVESFGLVVDSEFRTETFRKGVAFDAPLGTDVHAVASGRVRFAGWFRGYGKLVILDHGDEYFTVLGHLAEMKVGVGDAVRAREVIGRVGDTGSLQGPRLYFEIRHGGEPQDPSDWLRSRETG